MNKRGETDELNWQGAVGAGGAAAGDGGNRRNVCHFHSTHRDISVKAHRVSIFTGDLRWGVLFNVPTRFCGAENWPKSFWAFSNFFHFSPHIRPQRSNSLPPAHSTHPARLRPPSVMPKDSIKKHKSVSRDDRKVNTWDRTDPLFRHLFDEQGDLMGMFVPRPAVQAYFVASSSYLIHLYTSFFFFPARVVLMLRATHIEVYARKKGDGKNVVPRTLWRDIAVSLYNHLGLAVLDDKRMTRIGKAIKESTLHSIFFVRVLNSFCVTFLIILSRSFLAPFPPLHLQLATAPTSRSHPDLEQGQRCQP